MDNRHEHIRKTVRLVRHVAKFAVDFIEIRDRLFFVTENFYDLLSVHSLFDKTLDFSDRLLLSQKVLRALAAYPLRYEQYRYNAYDDHRP